MTRIIAALNSIHIPTFVTVFIASLLAQFAVTMNGAPVDITTSEGRSNLVMAIVLLLIKALQITPAVKVK